MKITQRNLDWLIVGYLILVVFVLTASIHPVVRLNKIKILSIRLDYILHFLLFIPWMILARWRWNWSKKNRSFFCITLVAGILMAGLFEIVQYFLPFRSVSTKDFIANVAGLGIGAFIYLRGKTVKAYKLGLTSINMRDFTSKVYGLLIESIMNAGYSFQTIENFIDSPAKKVVVLRHDSDIWPGHDLNIAKIENKYKVPATYYFRIPRTFHIGIITKIRDLGHEIGYHYENLADAKGDFDLAIKTFKQNLEKIRQIYPVRTVAFHGRPLSKWDSRRLWDYFSLGDFGLIGEPYISIDYQDILYLTDNGSCWDGEKANIRDTVKSNFNHFIHTTYQLIKAFENGDLPDRVIINAHAARWNDNLVIWTYRYFLQKLKNRAKYFYKNIVH